MATIPTALQPPAQFRKVTPIPQQQRQITYPTIEQQKETQGQKQLKELDKLIKDYEIRVKNAELRMKTAQTESGQLSADRSRELYSQQLYFLKQARQYAKSGNYQLQSIIDYALNQGYNRYAGSRPLDPSERLQKQQYQQYLKEMKRYDEEMNIKSREQEQKEFQSIREQEKARQVREEFFSKIGYKPSVFDKYVGSPTDRKGISRKPTAVIEPLDTQWTKPQLSLLEATQETIRRGVQDIKTLFGAEPEQEYSRTYRRYYQPKKEYYGMDIFSPIKRIGITRREQTEIDKGKFTGFIKSGTTPPDQPAFLTMGELTQGQKTKYLDVEKYSDIVDYNIALGEMGKDIKNKIVTDIQSKYESKITEFTTEEELNKINEDYEKEFQKKYETQFEKQAKKLNELRKLKGGYGRTGATIFSLGKSGAEIGAMTTPFTSIMYGVGRESYRERTGISLIDYNKYGGFSTYPYTKPDIETGVYFVGTGLSGLSLLRSTEKAIISEELRLLSEQRLKTPRQLQSLLPQKYQKSQPYLSIVQRTGQDKFNLRLIGEQRFRGLTTELEILGAGEKIGKKMILKGGMGEARTTGQLSWNLISGRPTYITSLQRFKIGAKSFPEGKLSDLIAYTGTQTLVPEERIDLLWTTKPKPQVLRGSFTESKLIKKQAKEISKAILKGWKIKGTITKTATAGLQKKLKGDLQFALSGKVTRVGIGKTIRGYEFIGKDYGLIKTTTPPSSTGVKFMQPRSIKKTPLWKTFGVSEKAIELLTISFKSIKKITKPIVEVKGLTSQELAPLMTGGFGLGKSRWYGVGTQIEEPSYSAGFIPALRTGLKKDYVSVLKTDTTFTQPSLQLKQQPEKILKRELMLKNILDTKALTQQRMNVRNYQDILTAYDIRSLTKQKTQPLIKQKGLGMKTQSLRLRSFGLQVLGGFGFVGLDFESRYRRGGRIGYDVEYLKHATKPRKRKWIQLNTKPVSWGFAMDEGSRKVDENISARFRLKPVTEMKVVKGKKRKVIKVFQQPLPQGSGYYESHKYKFRPYKVSKKRKIPLKETYIERARYRLDSPKETGKIQQERKASGLLFGGWLGIKKNSKRKKKNNFFRL